MIRPFMERTGETGKASRTGGKSLPAPDPTLPQFKVAEQDKEPA
jgi:hypothetical protein